MGYRCLLLLFEMNELELCKGIRLEVFLEKLVRLLFFAMEAGTEFISIRGILFPVGVTWRLV